MKTRQLHRNTARFCLALMSVCGLWGGSAAVAVEGAGREGQSVVAQNDASAEAERLYQEGMRLYREGTAESLQQALQVLERARVLFREVRNREKEALSFLVSGKISDDLSSFQQSLSYYNQALLLFQSMGNREGEAITYNSIGVVYLNSGNPQKALHCYNQALPLYQEINNSAGEAYTLNNIGGAYSYLGERQRALHYIEQALSLSRKVGDLAGEAAALNNIGRVYDELGESKKALHYLEQALPLIRELGYSVGEAASLNNIGRLYSGLGENNTALYYFNQALSLYRKVGSRAGEATTLSNMGIVYSALGEKQKALNYYNQALTLHQEVGNRIGEAQTLNSTGSVYLSLGERQRALDYYNQALSVSREVGDRSEEATVLSNIGSVYNDLGEEQKALDYYNQALSASREVGDRRGEATTLNNIGAFYSDLGKKQKALDYYNQALPLSRAVGDRRGEATTINNLGWVYFSLGKNQKALDYYNQALPLIQIVGDRAGEASTLNNIGVVYDHLEKKQKALDYYNQALLLHREVGNKQAEATTIKNLANLHRQQNQLPQALEYINTAITLIEDLRTKIDNTDLRTSYFATVQDYYQFKTDLLMQMGDPQEAFNTNERSRARTLLELLNSANLDLHEGADPQLLEQERQLRQQLQVIEARRAYRLNNNPTADAITALDRESDTVLGELNQLLAQIRRTHPAYADLKQPQPLTLPQIQQQVLDPETVLLQYSLGEERSYLWVVSQNGFQHYTLPGTQELAGPIKTFQNAASTGGSVSDTLRTGKPLAQLILPEPVWAQIEGKRVLVAGDGGLETIPFAALPLPDAPEYTPLLAKSEVLTQPSASSISVLRQQTQGRSLAPKTLALLADPVYTASDPRVIQRKAVPLPVELASTLRSLNRSDIERLPHTRREAEAILALVPDRDRNAVFDFAADRNWSVSPQLSQYRILHFATHGFANPVNPELSGVVLSLVNTNGLSRPGFLRLNDIFNLNLPVELVVLSACQTGLGENINGEGLVGLTRGFMYAGARRLVVSLWNVDDAATADLMASMYRKILQENMTPAAALRAAQLEMWKAGKTPNLWAAFTVRGEWK
jgi:CHAT domain-containing protein/Tfp pilus assembly protein PilF